MPSRYCRDELIKIALDMAQLPNLQIHDCPQGVVQPNAYSIQWLQDILDFWYHMVPFSAAVISTSLPATTNQSYVTLPSDFILDVRDGYIVQRVVGDTNSYYRAKRVPLQRFINRQLSYQNQSPQERLYPNFYCVQGVNAVGQQLLQIAPTPTVPTLATLWYYQLPVALNSNSKPRFPNDYVCIEYLRIRAKEWAGVFEPGTAQKFCERIVARMKAEGLMNEPEDDEIPFDTNVYGHSQRSGYSWMGTV